MAINIARPMSMTIHRIIGGNDIDPGINASVECRFSPSEDDANIIIRENGFFVNYCSNSDG